MPNQLLNDVKLYYLGGLPESVSPFVSSKGKVYALPPVGGYLTVPKFAAIDLMRRNQIVRQSGSFSVFSEDPRAAAQATRAPQQAVAQPRELTREELMAMLADMDAAQDVVIDDPAEPVAEVKKSEKVEDAPTSKSSGKANDNKKDGK